MYIKNIYLALVFKLVLVLVCGYGLMVQLDIFSGQPNWSVLNYFTILSNLLCFVYFVIDIGLLTKNYAKGNTTWHPALKGISMMSITVTMLVFHFMLDFNFSMGSAFGTSIFTTHYVVPIMVILDWLLWEQKGNMKVTSPLLWAIAPLVYFAYAMIAAQLGDGIGHNSRYPYPFMDVDAIGLGKVLFTVLIMVTVFIALGYLYVLADHLLKKLRKPGLIAD